MNIRKALGGLLCVAVSVLWGYPQAWAADDDGTVDLGTLPVTGKPIPKPEFCQFCPDNGGGNPANPGPGPGFNPGSKPPKIPGFTWPSLSCTDEEDLRETAAHSIAIAAKLSLGSFLYVQFNDGGQRFLFYDFSFSAGAKAVSVCK